MTWTDLPYATQQIDLSQLLVDRPQSLIKGPGQLRSSEGPKRLVDKTPMTERVNVVFSEMEHTLNHLPVEHSASFQPIWTTAIVLQE